MSYLMAQDTVQGASGSVFITVDGKNVQIAGMRNIRTNVGIQSSEMRVIGTKKVQTKLNGATQTGTGNIYYGNDQFREMALQYVNTGVMPTFDIQISVDGTGTTMGNEVTAYYGCQLTGDIPISILESEAAMLNFDFNFTWARAARTQNFNAPAQLGND